MKRTIEQTVIWATSEGVRCVVAPYDETRYQLRLLRAAGTVKADLFASLADADRAAGRWRAEVSEHHSGEWPPQLASEERRERGGAVVLSASSYFPLRRTRVTRRIGIRRGGAGHALSRLLQPKSARDSDRRATPEIPQMALSGGLTDRTGRIYNV